MEKTLMSRQHKKMSILPAASTNVLHVAFADPKNKWFRSALLGIFFIVISSAALAADPADAPRQYHAPRKGRFFMGARASRPHKNRRRQVRARCPRSRLGALPPSRLRRATVHVAALWGGIRLRMEKRCFSILRPSKREAKFRPPLRGGCHEVTGGVWARCCNRRSTCCAILFGRVASRDRGWRRLPRSGGSGSFPAGARLRGRRRSQSGAGRGVPVAG